MRTSPPNLGGDREGVFFLFKKNRGAPRGLPLFELGVGRVALSLHALLLPLGFPFQAVFLVLDAGVECQCGNQRDDHKGRDDGKRPSVFIKQVVKHLVLLSLIVVEKRPRPSKHGACEAGS